MSYIKKTQGNVARKTISWPEEWKGENVMYRVDGNVQWNDNIVVREDEYVVFMRDGKIMHIFDKPGRYALTTTNIPVLGTLGAAVTGIRQLGEVYYIQRRELRGKFGTKEPMVFNDREFGMVRIRMFGKFAYRLLNPELFITQFVGTKHYATSNEVIDWLRDEIVQVLNDTLGTLKEQKGIGVVELPQYLQEIEQMLLANITGELDRYGLKVTNIAGMTFNLPDEVQQAVDKRGAMGALGVNYMQYQTGKSLENMSQQEGGGAGMAGMGAGMGAGYGMASTMAQGMQQNQPSPAAASSPESRFCPNCGSQAPSEAKFCPSCGKPMASESKCGKCDSALTPGAKFCPSCGNAV